MEFVQSCWSCIPRLFVPFHQLWRQGPPPLHIRNINLSTVNKMFSYKNAQIIWLNSNLRRWELLYPHMYSSKTHWGPPQQQGPSACNQRSDQSIHEGELTHTQTPKKQNRVLKMTCHNNFFTARSGYTICWLDGSVYFLLVFVVLRGLFSIL